MFGNVSAPINGQGSSQSSSASAGPSGGGSFSTGLTIGNRSKGLDFSNPVTLAVIAVGVLGVVFLMRRR